LADAQEKDEHHKEYDFAGDATAEAITVCGHGTSSGTGADQT
jgi:hypothetical protein